MFSIVFNSTAVITSKFLREDDFYIVSLGRELIQTKNISRKLMMIKMTNSMMMMMNVMMMIEMIVMIVMIVMKVKTVMMINEVLANSPTKTGAGEMLMLYPSKELLSQSGLFSDRILGSPGGDSLLITLLDKQVTQ